MDKKTLLIFVLGGLLAVIVAASGFAYVQSQEQFQELAEVRLDPLGIAQFPTGPDPALAESDRRVVFFGDSRAQNWPPPSGLLQRAQLINRGIGRQTTAQALGRFDRHVAGLRPKIVVIQLGVNDLTKIAVLPERRDAIVAACEKNIDEIVARSKGLGAHVILTTIFPIGVLPVYRKLFWSNKVNEAISEVNKHLLGLAGVDVSVLDSAPLLVDDHGVIRSELSHDFLHLNAAGYQVLDRALVPLVAKLLG